MLYLRPLLCALALTLLAATPEPAAATKPGRAVAAPVTLEKSGARLHLKAPDLANLQREDARHDGKIGVPLRYGRVLPTGALDARAGAGVWTHLPDGNWSWRLDVSGPGAQSLEFAFSRFRLPHGASLLIRSGDGAELFAPLTDANNPATGALHTPILTGDHAVLELTVPAAKRDTLELTLAAVVWGYRDPFDAVRAKSGNCNVDTICPEGDAWREQIAAVAGYGFSESSDQLFCTGSLVNTGSVADDASHPHFVTAHHCVSQQAEAQTMVFYWGYESPSCRAIGSVENGTPLPVRPNTRAVQLGGATLVSTNRETDFTAVELSTPIPPEAQAWYSGWDRSGVIPPGTIGIHHAAGHEKRITLEADAPTTMSSCIISDGDSGTHWRVGPYESGTTEAGSSGSGLWNRGNGLLVGVLSGGSVSCANPGGYDCYGRLSAAWDVTSPTGTSIGAAFDRSGTNSMTMPGKGSCDAPKVSLSSAAFSTSPSAGQTFEIRASATGGAGGYTYLWDADGDGVIERESTDRIRLSFPSRRSLNVWVRVRDADGCVGSASHALDVAGPEVTVVQTGARVQICGNGNGRIDPGERYRIPVTLKNTGNAPLSAGARALFAPASSLPGNGIGNRAGYEGAAACGYAFIDIAEGDNAVEPLETYVANGNEYGPFDDARSSEIALQGSGFTLYGQTWDTAVMSTNGYVSFDPEESGGNWWVSCDGELDFGAKGPQLRPYHDDMVVRQEPGAGLRYRYFETCPRLANSGVTQGCHVFQWSGMGYYMGEDEVEGNFDFQAVAYAATGEVAYQYHVAAPDEGDLANIGLIGVAGDDPLNLYCESYEQPTKAETAICIHSPQALATAAANLRVEVPTLAVPALAPGASATVSLPVSIRPDAACAAPLSLDYIATAAVDSYSTLASRHTLGTVAETCNVVTSCSLAIPPIQTREGNYYNLLRSGNGFNYHDFGGIWYTAAPDHTPIWYGSAGDFVDNLLATPLWRTTLPGGPPPLQTGPVPTLGALDIEGEQVGRIYIARVSATGLLMAWDFADGGSGAELLRQIAQGVPRADPDHTQHWYPPSESGWGMDVESVMLSGRRFDAVWPYFYDAQGLPRWLLSDGFIENGFLALNSYRPHCPGCLRYADWDSRTQPAGSLVLRWTSANRATVTTDITLPPPLEGEWIRGPVPLIPIRAVQP